MCHCMKRGITFASLGCFLAYTVVKCQIPLSGSDVPSLSAVHWGMSKDEVKRQIHQDIQPSGDTALTFQDTFMDSTVRVVMTFGESDSAKGLRFIEIQFDDKNAEKLRSYLKSRYGDKYETEKKERSKWFFTIHFEAAKWFLKGESVVMVVFSQGEDVLGLSLLYGRIKQ